MSSTPDKGKYRKLNWKYIDSRDRDIRLFKCILEQKFLIKQHVIDFIFDGCESYALMRLRKLKKLGYLIPERLFLKEPECYLLGEPGVEALKKKGYLIGMKGVPFVKNLTLPAPQESVELAFYEHDKKVTKTRFLFEKMGFCHDWQSEKVLRMGTQGEAKVPDGLFTRRGRGIAVEIELHPKKNRTYRKIFEIYDRNDQIQFLFYLCASQTLMKRIMKQASSDKRYCFALYDDFVSQQGETEFLTPGGRFRLKAVLK